MKSYTDLEQSKKLAEILPLESADMYYYTVNGNSEWYKTPNVLESIDDLDMDGNSIPAWSLAALLELMPGVNFYKSGNKIKIENAYRTIRNDMSLIDAAFEMVVWLKENGKL